MNLVCEAEGNPAPHIKWVHENRMIDKRQVHQARIIFHHVQAKHQGLYTCTASNGILPDAIKSVFIDVLCKLILVHFCFPPLRLICKI